jgi:hypothetical protein
MCSAMRLAGSIEREGVAPRASSIQTARTDPLRKQLQPPSYVNKGRYWVPTAETVAA